MLRSTSAHRTSQLQALLVAVAIAVVAPLLVHLLPNSGNVPMGARLLPMYYAPLIAILLFDPLSGIVAGLIAPLINHLVTGMPVPDMMPVLTVELLVFALLIAASHRRWPRFWIAAPIAYLAAKAITVVLVEVIMAVTTYSVVLAPFVKSATNAIPGLVILTVLSFAIVRYRQSRSQA